MITKNSRRIEGRLITNDGREDIINPDDLDFDVPQGGIKRKKDNDGGDNDGGGGDGGDNIPDLIKEVDNEFVKGLNEIQINNIISKFNGSGFDKNGNVIDAEGKVLKKVDEFQSEIESENKLFEGVEKVEIEEVEYTLNENQDAVDKDGNVIKTRAELIELLKESDGGDGGDGGDDENYISQISSITGYNAVDEEGKPLEFENTIEGIAAREAHIVQQEATKLANQQLESFFDSNPDVRDMLNYKKLHGSLKDYATREDYTKIVLEDNNDDQHRAIIIKAELAKGNSEERAKMVAEFIMQDGKGKQEAENSLKYLKDKQIAEEQSLADKRKKEEDNYRQQVTKYYDDVAQVVQKGQAQGYIIPQNFQAKLPDGRVTTLHRNALFQLITEPISEGMSRYDLMRESDSVEQRVLDAYLRLTGYDITKLIAQKANNDKILKLKTAKQQKSTKITVHKDKTVFHDSDLDL